MTAEPIQPLLFEGGTLLLYRLFDVADEIDLERVESLLAGAGTRLKLIRERSEYLEIPRAPVTVSLGPRELTAASGRKLTAEANARLFNFGAVSIRYELALPSPVDSAAVAGLVHEFEASGELEAAARAETVRLCDRLTPALDSPHIWKGVETYTVFFALKVVGEVASRIDADSRVARILLAETSAEPLSPEEVKDATQYRSSYSEDDVCFVDWNAAIVLEPSGLRDIPDVLEFAAAQLLEFRFYDDLVDTELEGLYHILAKRREPFLWKFGGKYRRIGRQLNRRILETVEFIERVDNSLKVIADTYLARVYHAATDSFRLQAWISGVNRKQDLTRQVAEVLSNESQVTMGHLLELIIIVLILYEIVAPIVKGILGEG